MGTEEHGKAKGMFKDTLKFAGKIFAVNLATSFLGIITLTLLISAQVGFVICAVAGFIFIAFTLGVLWDNSAKRGADDCKATLNFLKNDGVTPKEFKQKMYYPAKGFIAGTIAMLPMIIVNALYIIGTFNGWEKGVSAGTQLLYPILYLAFISYTPFLRLATTADTLLYPTHYMPLGDSASGYFNQMTANSTVLPYMYIIPIVIAIVTVGICYIIGNKRQQQLYPEHVIKKYFKKQSEQANNEAPEA